MSEDVKANVLWAVIIVADIMMEATIIGLIMNGTQLNHTTTLPVNNPKYYRLVGQHRVLNLMVIGLV